MPRIRDIPLVDGPTSELEDPTPSIFPPGSLAAGALQQYAFVIQDANAQLGELNQLIATHDSELSALFGANSRLFDAEQALPKSNMRPEISALLTRESARSSVDAKLTALFAADPNIASTPNVVFTPSKIQDQRFVFELGAQEWESAFPLFPIFTF